MKKNSATRFFLFFILSRLVLSIPDSGGGTCLTPSPWRDSGPYFIYHGIAVAFCLDGPLLLSQKYELKLSFREPEGKFSLSLQHRTIGTISSRSPPGSRIKSESTLDKLSESSSSLSTITQSTIIVDSEKFEFWTNSEGNILLCSNDDVKLTPTICEALPVERIEFKVEASPRSFEHQRDGTGLWFNIRFDPIVYGFLPVRAMSLVFVIPFAFILTFLLIYVLLSLSISPLLFSQNFKENKIKN